MPVTLRYPGVYIEEVPSEVRTIVGVSTAITAFVGRAKKGLLNEPVTVDSYAEYARKFGGLWRNSPLSYAVRQYFENGGRTAIVVRVHNPGEGRAEFQERMRFQTASLNISLESSSNANDLILEAVSPGSWGNNLRAIIDHETKDKLEQEPKLFNLTIQEAIGEELIASERFVNLSTNSADPRLVTKVLKEESALVRVRYPAQDGHRPKLTVVDSAGNPDDASLVTFRTNTDPPEDADGADLRDEDIIPDPPDKQGLYALEKADLFNLLCIPPLKFDNDGDLKETTLTAALKYCRDRRAMLIVDPRSVWSSPSACEGNVDSLNLRDENAAIFFPRVRMADPLQENRLEEFAPCGVVAGVFARTDADRGVWKAPAGIEATLRGVRELSYKMTDGENGRLNPLGVNCLRNFPVVGNVLWGARTLRGADRLASEWKYIPVRRTALFIEESLYRGLQWVVFEPNDEPLWAQIRLNVGAFMHDLFRKGAFQGTSPRQAYFVKCDKETTTQNDINLGIVNIVVGFAPLKPAEFVVLKIQQMAGQIET